MIDTHCHIFDKAFDADRSDAVARAQAAGVTMMLMPNVDSGTYNDMMRAASAFPQLCLPMAGVHPTSITPENMERELSFVRSALENTPPKTFVAVGEIGVDCYWSRGCVRQQQHAFERQLRMAEQHGLPVVIHARDSFNEILEVLRSAKPNVKGVFHAFSGDAERYRDVKKLGDYKLGVGGMVTFKNAALPDVVRQAPLSDLLLETDAPYLTPAPFRGKRNESAHLALIAQKIADIKGLTLKEVADATTANAIQLFGVSPPCSAVKPPRTSVQC
ncbi:MAG: TatD family hydrolase [Prevotellaceae bacterium]|nr:TatD family hydrolase [Prevotellaceae bacterium]